MYRIALAAAAVYATMAHAAGEEKPCQLGPHEHGHGYLNIAIDGSELVLELQAPGSEFRPDVGKKPGDEALEKLQTADAMFGFPAEADCALKSAKAHFTVIEAADHDHERAEKDHGHKAKHGQDHAKVDSKGHSGAEQGLWHAGHRDYHGAYAFTCAQPAKLTTIDLRYFATFPLSGKLTVQAVGSKGAIQANATRDEPVVNIQTIH